MRAAARRALRVAVCSRHALAGEALALRLSQTARVAATLSDRLEGDVDVVLVDGTNAADDVDDFIGATRRRFPSLPLVVLGGGPFRETDATVSGWLPEGSDPEDLIQALVRAVTDGTGAGDVADGIQPSDPLRMLTPRERTVVELVLLGMADDDIAEKLGISAMTVRSHVRNAVHRLGLGSREALAGLVEHRRPTYEVPLIRGASQRRVAVAAPNRLRREAIHVALRDQPGLLLMDDEPSEGAGAATDLAVLAVPDALARCRHLRASSPVMGILVIGQSDDHDEPTAAFLAGATGYVPRSASVAELGEAARRVAFGDVYVPSKLVGGVIRRLAHERHAEADVAVRLSGLTRRERTFLRYLSQGVPDETIAAELFLSSNTVRTHVQNLLRKLGLASRREAAGMVRASEVARRVLGEEG